MTDKEAYIETLERKLREAKDGERLLAGELEGREMVSKCWRVGCIVFFVCFAALVAVCVGRGRM